MTRAQTSWARMGYRRATEALAHSPVVQAPDGHHGRARYGPAPLALAVRGAHASAVGALSAHLDTAMRQSGWMRPCCNRCGCAEPSEDAPAPAESVAFIIDDAAILSVHLCDKRSRSADRRIATNRKKATRSTTFEYCTCTGFYRFTTRRKGKPPPSLKDLHTKELRGTKMGVDLLEDASQVQMSRAPHV